MMTATTGTTHCKKMKLHIIFEYLNCADLLSASSGLTDLVQATLVPTMFNSKGRYQNLSHCGLRSPKCIGSSHFQPCSQGLSSYRSLKLPGNKVESFHDVVLQGTAKKCTKIQNARA